MHPTKYPGLGTIAWVRLLKAELSGQSQGWAGLGWVLTYFRPVTRGSSYTNRGFILSALTIEVSHGPEVEFCFPWACRYEQVEFCLLVQDIQLVGRW
jgi:hypothetical protein